jgi:DNA-binding response OmpR family regulator
MIRASADSEMPVPRILIVEDSSGDAVCVHRILQDFEDSVTKRKYELWVAADITSARKHLSNDEIDIYILDLEMPETKGAGPSEIIGTNFFHEVVSKTNAGIIVCSDYASDRVAEELLDAGADDSVCKHPRTQEERIPTVIKSRVRAVWRRVQLARPRNSGMFAHTGRVFLIGDWRFVVGERVLVRDDGESIRLTPTEHAFLRYICLINDHRVDMETFNQDILGRVATDPGPRLDNFIYRLRVKFRNSIELRSVNHATYRLFNVRELKPGVHLASVEPFAGHHNN